MTDAASRDYSWGVPNRRFIDSGLYLPSIRSEGIDSIAVIIDTSGSLPAQTLAEFWTELREVAAEIRPASVFVLQVDAALQDAAEYATDEIAVKGRGGTDFRPGFEWLDQQGIQPAVCVYFTDMECSSYPEAEPEFPVLLGPASRGRQDRLPGEPAHVARSGVHRDWWLNRLQNRAVGRLGRHLRPLTARCIVAVCRRDPDGHRALPLSRRYGWDPARARRAGVRHVQVPQHCGGAGGRCAAQRGAPCMLNSSFRTCRRPQGVCDGSG